MKCTNKSHPFSGLEPHRAGKFLPHAEFNGSRCQLENNYECLKSKGRTTWEFICTSSIKMSNILISQAKAMVSSDTVSTDDHTAETVISLSFLRSKCNFQLRFPQDPWCHMGAQASVTTPAEVEMVHLPWPTLDTFFQSREPVWKRPSAGNPAEWQGDIPVTRTNDPEKCFRALLSGHKKMRRERDCSSMVKWH